MLEEEKTKYANHLAIMNKRRDEYMKAEFMYELRLAQLKEEIDYIENQYRLPRLDNRILGLLDNGGMYFTYSVYSMGALTYSEHNECSKLIDDLALKIFDASIDYARI